MATPMHVYAEIAARYGVDPLDADAVDNFYLATLVGLAQNLQEQILAELLARDGEAPDTMEAAQDAASLPATSTVITGSPSEAEEGPVATVCPHCGAANTDAVKFCGVCATLLVRPSSAGGTLGDAASIRTRDILHRILARVDKAPRKVDILFVLDRSGSMRGEIEAIEDTSVLLADSLSSDGVTARFGLIEFGDRLSGGDHQVHSFGGEQFTEDPAAFRGAISALRAHGGGDEPESSFDALMLACRQQFSADANKVIVLVTDAGPHVPDLETRSILEVQMALRLAGLSNLFLVIPAQDSRCQTYLELLSYTQGQVFDLGTNHNARRRAEDFKNTLMAIGRTISRPTSQRAPHAMTSSSLEYDVALSFAGENRPQAEALASILSANGLRVFYDAYDLANLWGKDLYQHLVGVYRDKARLSVVILSAAYTEKLWTNYELEVAQRKAFDENAEHILAIRLDNTEFPSAKQTIDLRNTTVNTVAALVIQKLQTRYQQPQ